MTFRAIQMGCSQLAHHVASVTTIIPLIVGSHIHEGDFLDGPTTQADNAVRVARESMDMMRLTTRPDFIAGRNKAPARGARPEETPAARRIIAEALRLRPEIGTRIRLRWIGGPAYGYLDDTIPARLDQEYNISSDIAAAQTIFNDSTIGIWQVPRNVYRKLLISHAEIDEGLKNGGAPGRFLLERLARVTRTVDGLGETYILGDSPLVTLSSLLSSFGPDASSSDYIVRSTPRLNDRAGYDLVGGGRPMRLSTTIDTWLTFADMFMKFRAASLP